MKKILNRLILISAISIGLTSCKKDFLERSPTNRVDTEVAFSTTKNIWLAINGIHRAMYNQIFEVQSQGGQSGNMMYMDIMGDDVVLNVSTNNWHVAEYQWNRHRDPGSNLVYYNYMFYYVIISNANMIISKVDNATGSAEDKAILKGQALAYRAWAYFQMVQLFGERYVAGQANSSLAVPLILEPTTEKNPRNTVAEVYAQINADLDDAIANLTGYDRGTNKSHLNINVAKGLKARVALVQENWPAAIKFAQEARAGFALMTNAQYSAGFNNYSVSEWMWGSKIQADQTNSFYSFFAHMSANYSSGVIRTNPRSINSKLYDWIPATDIRKTLWDPTGKNTSFPIPTSTSARYPYMNRKFRVADASLSIGDVPYMRSAEMYLIEAEAQARSGNDALAAQALYPLAVNRNPSYVLSTNTGAALINEIMMQRRAEFWGEGFRFYDLKRTNSVLDRTGSNHNAAVASKMTEPAGTKLWQFLIPQAEINATNGVVTQNPL